MKRWRILNKTQFENTTHINEKIIKVLLQNRGLTDKKAIAEFLNPRLENILIESVGINKKQLAKAMNRILKAIENKEQIIVYGDYDADGITGTAILWEALNSIGARVLPYIPDRIEEGYGLSVAGISKIKDQKPARIATQSVAGGSKISDVKLIITVDNGIVANEAVDFANENKIDVIITDHHTIGEKLPEAFAVVYTTKLCGAGIAWILSKELKKTVILSGAPAESRSPHSPIGSVGMTTEDDTHLELAVLGTIADMVPLTGANRTIVKFGLEKLARTRRPGLLALFNQAGLNNNASGEARNIRLTTYEVGFIIAPRLNAAGRIENAMDSLRLLCTNNKDKAQMLAEKLELTNRERQFILKQTTQHACLSVKMQDSLKKILVIAHESYQQGVIGLVAGKLVEEFYRPSIVVSLGEKYSKASARSIDGFNIIEFLRSQSEYFVNVGGHPMAAGFTVETGKIIALKESLENKAESLLNSETLIKTLKIDYELPLYAITKELYKSLNQLAPFGMANPEPVFATRDVMVNDLRVLGRDGKHLKLILNSQFEAIAFNMGELAEKIKIGDKISLAYTIDENTWNGNTKLQLKVKDIKTTLVN